MTRKRVWTISAGILVMVLVLAALFFRWEDTPANAYRTVPVKKGDIRATVSSTGKLAPLNTVEVGSQISGTIKALYADYNSAVIKDQVIALIDPAIYTNQLNKARAALQSAEGHLFAARATLKEAELHYNRLAGLATRRTVAAAEHDAALARRDNAMGAVRMAEALVAERKAGLGLAETNLNFCTIRSPIDGVVIARNVDVGQTVAATLQSPVLFTIAEDLTRMQVEADVSEADVGQVKPGQEVEFTVDAFSDKTFRASTRQVRNAASEIQNVVTYKIVADVRNDALLLRPGMTANVTIVISTVRDVLTVPNAALRFKPKDEGGGAAAGQTQRIEDREFYKDTVKELDLDSTQAKAFVGIIERAAVKLKAAYALPEDSRDLKQAWCTFFIQVLTDLYKILREDQVEKFAAYRLRLKEKYEGRTASDKAREGTVYVLRGKKPVPVSLTVDITDDTETQVISGDLKEGDKVIVGYAIFSATASERSSGTIFSRLSRRGR